MKLKVIKDIKGLVEGDLLYYNKDKEQFEINKVDEEITDKGYSKKTTTTIIGDWLVNDYSEYLQRVDDDGNLVSVDEFEYVPKDTPPKPECIKEEPTELELVKKENEELKKQLEDLKKSNQGFPLFTNKYWPIANDYPVYCKFNL
jgi:hypothetical protein